MEIRLLQEVVYYYMYSLSSNTDNRSWYEDLHEMRFQC